MQIIRNQEFGGERPLYASHDLRLENVTIHVGESSIKESSNIEAENCRFEGKYVIWECADTECRNCYFAPSDRAPMWYCRNLKLFDCLIDAPKVFREIDRPTLERIKMTDGAEAFWYCRSGEISDLQIEQGTYAFMHTDKLQSTNLQLQGKYTFQYARNIEIHNAVLDTKDAFWNSENVTVYDAEIQSEYLGWYSKNLRLVRCRIAGTQPLCYAENLVLEDCSFAPDADRAFEKSSVKATIIGDITSIVDPLPGSLIENR